MKICNCCGKEIDDNALFCQFCGKEANNQIIVKDEEVKQSKKDKVFSVFAKVGKILGYCSIGCWIIPFLGFIASVYGIVFSSLGLYSSLKEDAKKALTLNIIFAVVGFIFTCLAWSGIVFAVIENIGVIY